MKNKKSRGMAALILIISLILATILIVIVINFYTGGIKGEPSVQSPIAKAKNVTCLAQRHNIEIAIRYYLAQESKYPSNLSELMKYSNEITDKSFQCPVTGSAYNYDPQTGNVTCPDHQ
jgi:hypothetical protein